MISNRGVRCLLSIHVLVSFVLVGVAASGAQKGGEPELEADFPSLSAVYKEFKPQSAVLSATDSSWSKYAYPKGAKKVNQGLPNIHFFNLRTGSSFCSEYFTVSTIYVRTGTVIAFPREGFEVERSFTYIDLDESGKKAVLNGKWVAVDVVIGYPNELKPPSEHACAV
ncbi:hypothetical protein, partial [Fibrobacter sp.]|uniref:hypothetical protein n=1 Tax=Fibrobacter sp. TaxID=35828 RepID=UPI0038902F20